MILGVPTLCCYAKLDRLIESAKRGSSLPSRYIIIDNGGHFDPVALDALYFPTPWQVVRPGRNIGVAASWNKILALAGDEPVLISNDDVVFEEGTLRAFEEAVGRSCLAISPHGWDLFAQTRECSEKVGAYDERFTPAYFEDQDYARRAKIAGVTPTVVVTPYQHDRSSTLAQYPEAWKIRAGADRNKRYYVEKWGGEPGRETFNAPFTP
jgi:GT2 family glycosyltransferase